MKKKCLVKEVSILLIVTLMLSSFGVIASTPKVSKPSIPMNGGNDGGTERWPMYHNDLTRNGYSKSSGPETAVVCGYVTDVETSDPLESAEVDLDWEGNINWNTTYTYTSGFYSMNLAAGEIKLDVYLDGYLREFSDNFNIGEYETLWLNFSMYLMPLINSYI